MSFFFEEDHDVVESQEDAGFVCLNCGGSDSYKDDETGALCCSSCFTQSQNMTADQAELDFGEVQALAGRTRSGQILSTRKSTGTSYKRERKALEEYDSSVPLPDLKTCLLGFQQVLKYGASCISDLAELDEEGKKSVKETVRMFWRNYLQSWTDAAEFYGKLHPEIRFSLRDSFLSAKYKSSILRHLSYNISKKIKQEYDEIKQQQKEETEETAELHSDEGEESSVENNTEPPYKITSQHKRTIARHYKTYQSTLSLMQMYWDRGRRGRLEAAIIISPNLRLATCILWLSVSRMGVTIQQVLDWIANGALPLQNAYRHCLDKDEQESLKLVSQKFRMSSLPEQHDVEMLAQKVVVASGLKSFEYLKGKVGSKVGSDNNSKAFEYAGRVTCGSRGSVTRPDFSFVPVDAVPLMAERLVRVLGFEQRVLDFSLALMGRLKDAPNDIWLPPTLNSARPDRLWTQAHVLAVIVVACKMTPGWETWTYPKPGGSVASKAKQKLPTEGGTKRQKTLSKGARFIPYNDPHLRLLGNGSDLNDYLDFLESNVFESLDRSSAFADFAGLLRAEEPIDKDEVIPVGGSTIRQNPILLGAPNPNQPSNMWRRQKLHDWNLRLGKSKALWADANALGEYPLYTNGRSHVVYRRIRNARYEATQPTPEPFHAHYGTLLEYIAYRTNVKPSKIHAVVHDLDEEVTSLVRDRHKKP